MIMLCQYKQNMKMFSVDNYNFLFLLVELEKKFYI